MSVQGVPVRGGGLCLGGGGSVQGGSPSGDFLPITVVERAVRILL